MKRAALIVIAIVAVALFGASIAWWYVFHTDAGLNLVLGRVKNLSGVHITVAQATGHLGNTVRIRHLEIDEAHAHVVADDVQLQLTPAALWFGTIRIASVGAARVDVRLKESKESASDRPVQFLPSLLRLRVAAGDFRRVHVETATGTAVDAGQVRTQLTMTAHRLRVRNADVESDRFKAQGDLTLTSARPLGLQVDAALQIPALHGPEFAAKVKLAGNPEQLQVTATLTAPSQAKLRGTLSKKNNRWVSNGTIGSDAFALSPWLEHPPFSLHKVAVQFTTDDAAVHLTGSVVVPELDAQPLTYDLQAHYADKVIAVTHGLLQPANSHISVTTAARIDLSDGRPNVAATAEWHEFRWPLRGDSRDSPALFTSSYGQLSMYGTLPFTIGLQADLVVRNDLRMNLSGYGQLAKDAVSMDDFTLDALDGQIKGNGRITFSRPVAWRIDATGHDLNPVAISSALPGKLRLAVRAAGTDFGKQSLFDVTLTELDGMLRGERVHAAGSVTRERGRRAARNWRARNVTVSLGASRASVEGIFGDRYDMHGQLNIASLKRFFPKASGALRLEGDVKGTYEHPHIVAALHGDKLHYDDWQASALSGTADIDFAARAPSSLDVTAEQLQWRNLGVTALHVSGGGTQAKHAIHVRVTPEQRNAARLSAAKLDITGGFDHGTWSGTFTPLSLVDSKHGAPTVAAAPAAVRIGSGNGQVQQWCATWRARKLCADASWSHRLGWQVAVTSDPLPLNMFDAIFTTRPNLRGQWQIDTQLRAPPNRAWTGNGAIQVNDASFTYQPIEGAEEIVQVGSGRIDMSATAQNLIASLTVTTPGTTSMNAVAQIERGANGSIANLPNAPLTSTIHVQTADANILPVLIPNIDRAAGSLRVVLGVHGSLSNPLVSGDIRLSEGELALYRYNMELRELGVHALIVDNHMTFTGDGRAGDGHLSVDGDMQWRDGAPMGKLHIQGDRLLLADLPEYRVVASPNLQFAVDDKHIDVTGEVLIPSAHIQPIDLRGAVQLSPDARLINAPPESADGGYVVKSDIKIKIGDDVRLDTFGLRGKLQGEVMATTRPKEPPRGRGELSVSDGQYEAYGQKLTIERGRLLFDASPLDNPGLDILAVRKLEEQTVGVTVRGTLRNPLLTLYADPSLPQSQIVAYLLTGHAVEDMRSQDTAAVGNATNALAVQGGGLLASQIGRRLGLQEVSVESNGLNDTSLVLGKFLSPRLFVSYGISLTESLNTLKARYTISDRWVLKAEVGQVQSADIEFRVER